MTSLIPGSDPSIVDVHFTDEAPSVTLEDSRVLWIPLEWYLPFSMDRPLSAKGGSFWETEPALNG